MKVIRQDYCNWADPKEKRQEKIDTSFIRIRIHPCEFEEGSSGNKLEHRDFNLYVYTSERTGKPYVCISRVLTKREENYCEPISHTEPPENYQ